MLHTIKGKLTQKGADFIIVDTGAFGFKVMSNSRVVSELPKAGSEIKLYCFLYVRDNDLELYGFLEQRSLKLFEMLNSVSGIGPKTALGVLDVAKPDKVVAAIVEGKTATLTRASGIGKKTAERVILELRNRLELPGAGEIAETMDVDADIEDTLVNLGYGRREAKEAIGELGKKPKELEERLKEALKLLAKE